MPSPFGVQENWPKAIALHGHYAAQKDAGMVKECAELPSACQPREEGGRCGRLSMGSGMY